MPEPKRSKYRINVGGNEYAVSDVKRSSGAQTRQAFIGRQKPARSVSFKPVGGAPRVPALTSREGIDRNSPIVVSRLNAEEIAHRRKDQLRSDVVRGIAAGFLAERGLAMGRPLLEAHRANQARAKGKPYKSKAPGPTIAAQVNERLAARRANPYTKKQLESIRRDDPFMRHLPPKKGRWLAQRTGPLNYKGPKVRAMRHARGFGVGLGIGLGGGAYRYLKSKKSDRPEYTFKFGTPKGREVQELPLG